MANSEGMREQIQTAINTLIEEVTKDWNIYLTSADTIAYDSEPAIASLTKKDVNLLTDAVVLSGPPRDEYHTMTELYNYRMVYNAWAVKAWLYDDYEVVKSKRHHTGELCFDGEYFIVVAQLPTGQVSNHYKIEYWNLFVCPEVERPLEWDGHTPEVAFNRMYNALTNEERYHYGT